MICPFCAKYTTFDLKKYREVIFHDSEEYQRLEERLACGLENDMRNLANFPQNIQKSQKCALWSASSEQMIKCMTLKGTEELCLMALNIDAKFEEKLTCAFKNDMRN